jgi:hypothetical protein
MVCRSLSEGNPVRRDESHNARELGRNQDFVHAVTYCQRSMDG